MQFEVNCAKSHHRVISDGLNIKTREKTKCNTHPCDIVLQDSITNEGAFTLGAQALVPGSGHKIVLCTQIVVMYTFNKPSRCSLTERYETVWKLSCMHSVFDISV